MAFQAQAITGQIKLDHSSWDQAVQHVRQSGENLHREQREDSKTTQEQTSRSTRRMQQSWDAYMQQVLAVLQSVSQNQQALASAAAQTNHQMANSAQEAWYASQNAAEAAHAQMRAEMDESTKLYDQDWQVIEEAAKDANRRMREEADITGTHARSEMRQTEERTQASHREMEQSSRQAALGMRDSHARAQRSIRSEMTQTRHVANLLRDAFFFLGGIGLARGILNTSLEMERINRTLEAVTGSAELAAQEFEFVRHTSESLKLNLASTAQTYADLMAAANGTNLAGKDSRDIFIAVAEAMLVLGRSEAEVEGAFRAIEQMISKGTVQAEELRGQLGERLPGAFQLASRAMGVTTTELGKMLEQGQILAEDLLPALAQELHRTYGPSVANAVTSTQAKINAFNNALFRTGVALAEAGANDLFVSLLERAADALENYAALTDETTISSKQLQMVSLEVWFAIEEAIDAADVALNAGIMTTLADIMITFEEMKAGWVAGLATMASAANAIPKINIDMTPFMLDMVAINNRIIALEKTKAKLLVDITEESRNNLAAHEETLQEIEDEINSLQAAKNARTQQLDVENAITMATEETAAAAAEVDEATKKQLETKEKFLQGFDDEIVKMRMLLDGEEDRIAVMEAQKKLQEIMEGGASQGDLGRVEEQVNVILGLEKELELKNQLDAIDRELIDSTSSRGARLSEYVEGLNLEQKKLENIRSLTEEQVEIENQLLDIRRQFPDLSREQEEAIRAQLQALQNTEEEHRREQEQMEEKTRRAESYASTITDGISDAVTGAKSFEDALAAVNQKLLEITLRALVFEKLEKSLTSAFGGGGSKEESEGGGWAGLLGSIIGGVGGFFGGGGGGAGIGRGGGAAGAGGGSTGPSGPSTAVFAARGAVIRRPTLLSNDPPTIGGEAYSAEAVLPLRRGADGNLGVASGAESSKAPIHITLVNQLGMEPVLQAMSSDPGREIIVGTVDNDISTNGSLRGRR